jgi:hypothetical protein
MAVTDFRIDCEFEQGHSTVAEHRATWARVEIWVNDRCVSRFQDKYNDELRSGILRPVYPVAEWLLVNWWALSHEFYHPNRRGYWRRHNLRAAEEGFALPNIEFFSQGELTEVRWTPHHEDLQKVEFFDQGSVRLPREDVQAEFARLIERVVQQLRKRKLTGTFVETEFEALNQLHSDEREFCRAAGAFGLDPFQIDFSEAEAIEHATSEIPAALHDELFAVAELQRLQEMIGWVHQATNDCQQHCFATERLRPMARGKSQPERKKSPWQLGYERARELIQEFRLTEKLPVRLDLLADDLDDFAKTSQNQGFSVRLRWIDLLGDASDATELQLSTTKRRPDSRRITVARALGDFLTLDRRELFVITASPSSAASEAATARQQFNRAFAAELLAPAEALQRRVSADDVLSEEEIGELADDFQVSQIVILRQLENHGLASVTSNPQRIHASMHVT